MPVLLCSYSKTRMKLILVFFKNGTNLVYHFYSMNSAGGVGSLFLLGTQRGPCCHANEPWQVGSSNDLPSSSWHHSKIHPVEGGDMEEFFIPNRLVTTQKGMREGFFFCNFLSGCFFLYIYIYSCYIYICICVCFIFDVSILLLVQVTIYVFSAVRRVCRLWRVGGRQQTGFDCSVPGSRDYRGESLRVTSCGAQCSMTWSLKTGLQIPHLFENQKLEGVFMVSIPFWGWVE